MIQRYANAAGEALSVRKESKSMVEGESRQGNNRDQIQRWRFCYNL
jgi:hypothetical protein